MLKPPPHSADSALPFPPQVRRQRKRITVIGAGISGLVAAYELERRGHSVEVLEGRLELGGRVRTHRFLPGQPGPSVELGAMRVPITHRRTMRCIGELGLADRVREFTTLFQDENAYLETGSGHQRIRDASRTLVAELRRRLPEGECEEYDDATVLFGAWLAVRVNAIAPGRFRESISDGLDHEMLRLVDGIDLSPFVYGAARDRIDLHALFAHHPQIQAGCTGRLYRFVEDIVSETSTRLIRLRGGMDQLVHRLRDRVRGPIRRGQEVVGIETGEREVSLRVRRGFGTVTKSCDYVLCTVPFSVLRGMDLVGFDAEKSAIVHDMKYWSATKVSFHCREAFWEREGITGGASFTGGLVRQTYYPPVEGDPRLGAALMASYAIGEDADVLGGLTRSARLAVVLDEVSAVHPQLRQPGMILGVADQVWGDAPSSMGAAAVRWGKDIATCESERRSAARRQGRLFFAGEHCSTHPAWIEGAIESADNAVREIEYHEPGADAPVTADEYAVSEEPA
ncbi:flavin monoamine oxidase family protein [Embleya sp. AB8]|uniref:flavin monoamine oxidase family protein n=1 Tax=Embleya sp. AB8 TaxID=3156304 RepID=UPI003C788779